MARYIAFRYCLNPTVEQQAVLSRHAGAARFAFNQCLRIVKTALTQRKSDPGIDVPWTRFDLINTFNTWKKTAVGDPARHRDCRRPQGRCRQRKEVVRHALS
jgi:putative transposase